LFLSTPPRRELLQVFMREYASAALEDLRNAALERQVILIQSWWRMILVRRLCICLASDWLVC
jgi:myosin heavy subunit